MAMVTGIVIVKVDGDIMRSKEGAKIMLGGYERTPVTGHKLYGPARKFVAATLEFTLAHTGDTDLLGIQSKISSTLEFECDSGQTYMIGNAFCTKPAELTGGEGDVAFEFSGDPAELV